MYARIMAPRAERRNVRGNKFTMRGATSRDE
jgi:hypothetical protein